MATFLQWNIRSIQANREELQVLFRDCNPSVVCIQETLLKDTSNVGFRNHSLYHCPGTENNGTFHGGVAILVNNSVAHKSVPLNCRKPGLTLAIKSLVNFIKVPARIFPIPFL